MAGEWWRLSEAIAWIACRRAIAFYQWDDSVFPPSESRGLIAANEYVSEAAAQQLNAQDDGVSAAIESTTHQLFQAAADGRVTLRGVGPYWPDAVRRGKKPNAIEKAIEKTYFCEGGRSALPGCEAIWPEEAEKEPSVYLQVTVSAKQMRAIWPKSSQSLLRAIAWMNANITRPGAMKGTDAIARCMGEARCTKREAIAALNKLPPHLRRGRGRPRKTEE
ncbi:MAG: hypothetical protein INF88_17665 [Roseomonas sp.]|nr:hypothetical protein [Roseomonas sp.]